MTMNINADRISEEDRKMVGVCIMQIGEEVDSLSLQTALDVMSDPTPAYLRHDEHYADRVGEEVGYFTGFRIEGDKLVANFAALESWVRAEPQAFERLFEIARLGLPCGLSVVATVKPADGPLRFEAIYSVDFVSRGRLTPNGLFSAQPQSNMEEQLIALQEAVDTLQTSLDAITQRLDALEAEPEPTEEAEPEMAAEDTEDTEKVVQAAVTQAMHPFMAKLNAIALGFAATKPLDTVETNTEPRKFAVADREKAVQERIAATGCSAAAAFMALAKENPNFV